MIAGTLAASSSSTENETSRFDGPVRPERTATADHRFFRRHTRAMGFKDRVKCDSSSYGGSSTA